MIDRSAYWFDYLKRPNVENVFPRWVTFMRSQKEARRYEVPSINEFNKLVEQFDDGTWNCFVSLFSKEQFLNRTIDCIFFEIDRNTPEESNQACMLVEMQMENLGIKYREYWTGRRGKHYYIPIESVQLDYVNDAIGNWLKTVFPMEMFSGLKKNGSMTFIFDWGAFGRIHQMVRIPYTMHMKTKRFSMESKGFISDDMSIYQGKWEVNKGISEKLKELDFPTATDFGEYLDTDLKIPLFPKCIRRMIHNIDRLEYDHQAHLHLASFLKFAGYDIERTIKIFKLMPEYDDDVARYQLNDIYSRDLLPFKCRNVIDLGLCDYDQSSDCPMWPYIVARVIEFNRTDQSTYNKDKQSNKSES